MPWAGRIFMQFYLLGPAWWLSVTWVWLCHQLCVEPGNLTTWSSSGSSLISALKANKEALRVQTLHSHFSAICCWSGWCTFCSARILVYGFKVCFPGLLQTWNYPNFHNIELLCATGCRSFGKDLLEKHHTALLESGTPQLCLSELVLLGLPSQRGSCAHQAARRPGGAAGPRSTAATCRCWRPKSFPHCQLSVNRMRCFLWAASLSACSCCQEEKHWCRSQAHQIQEASLFWHTWACFFNYVGRSKSNAMYSMKTMRYKERNDNKW